MAPSRADATTERKAILDAALRVMRKNGYAECQITDILTEASLSTRAFYRHFKTKDDVLIALYRDNAEAASRRLAEKVSQAGSPTEQLQVWIEETLSLGYDRRRASRVRVTRVGRRPSCHRVRRRERARRECTGGAVAGRLDRRQGVRCLPDVRTG